VNGEVPWIYQVGDLAKGASSDEVVLGVAGDGQGNAYTLVNAMGEREYGLWVLGISR
jgi:hypothetical protein